MNVSSATYLQMSYDRKRISPASRVEPQKESNKLLRLNLMNGEAGAVSTYVRDPGRSTTKNKKKRSAVWGQVNLYQGLQVLNINWGKSGGNST